MTDHTAVVQGMAAGVGGAVLALLGVDAQHLTIALIACALGARLGPAATGRWQAVYVFSAAVCASAVAASVLGPLAGRMLPVMNASEWSRLSALVVGMLLHPLIQAGAEVPTAVVKVVARWIGRRA